MIRRLIQGLMAVALVTGGVAVATASPALAESQCNTSARVHACINWGAQADHLQLWLNLTTPPDASVHHFGVILELDGKLTQEGSGAFTTAKNYGPWKQWLNGTPDREHTARTIIYVYTSTGFLHMTVKSPPVKFWA